jgi:hypothetical protein
LAGILFGCACGSTHYRIKIKTPWIQVNHAVWVRGQVLKPLLSDYLENHASIIPCENRTENRPYGPDVSTLLSDDIPQITFGNFKLKNRSVATHDFFDRDIMMIIDQTLF